MQAHARATDKAMKKTLSLILRLSFAAAGIAYIIYSLTWYDHVALPVNDPLLAAHNIHAEAPMQFRVIGRDGDQVRIRIGDGEATLPVDTLTDDESAQGRRNVPGIFATLRQADVGLLALAMLLIAPIYPIQMVRWWILMRARDIEVTLGKTFRLVMVGSFFNYCMPGTTGGDLVKAYYAAKNSDRRADAVMSVIFDRIAGLFGLIVLAAIVGLFMLHDPTARKTTIYIWALTAILILGGMVYFSTRLRRMLGLERIIALLPGELVAKVDQAAVAYRHHKAAGVNAVALGVVVHLCIAVSTAIAGYALGLDAPLGLLLTVVPVLFLAASIPITPQGLGVMEGIAFVLLLDPPMVTKNHLVGMLLLARVFQILYSMAGSLFLLKGDIHMHPAREVNPQGAGAIEGADV